MKSEAEQQTEQQTEQKRTERIMSPLERSKNNPTSLRAAINAKCYECTCYNKPEVGRCPSTDCPLWKLRPWKRT